MNKLNQEVIRFLTELNHPFFEEINELRKIILGSEKENDRAIVTFNSLIEIQLQKSVICENVSNWIQNL